MDSVKISGVKLEAVYACVPDVILDNEKECAGLFGAGVENLIKSTGIKKRYVVSNGVSSLDLCCTAAQKLFADTGINKNDVGAVICVTFTPEYLMPCNAVAAQERLGLGNGVAAFDIAIACSGYCYGIWVASMMAKSMKKKVLLLNGDVQSVYTSKLDKSTAPVLSDAGTATVIAPCTDGDTWTFAFYSDGSGREKLYIPAGGSKGRIDEKAIRLNEMEDGSQIRDVDIHMDGFAIFKFVAQDVSKLIKSFMSENDIAEEDVDAFIPHQANIYMIEQLTKKLKISSEKLWKSGDEYGNPASSSVPLTIASQKDKHFSEGKKRMLLSGFGGGLSASIGYLTMDASVPCKAFQYERKEQ